MTGWNMPPGCNVSDIPGNRPEDEAQESFFDWVFETIGNHMSESATNKLAEALWLKVGEAYTEGYKAGLNDEAMAQEYKKEEEE